MPEVEVEVDRALVRRLLATLAEGLRHLRTAPVQPVATGWDNAVWRLGERYAVRIPVRAQARPAPRERGRVDGRGELSAADERHPGPRPVHHGVTPTLRPWP